MLNGQLNAGFAKLSSATYDMLSELSQFVTIEIIKSSDDAQTGQLQQWLSSMGYQPTQIYETTGDGRQQQTIVYPYCLLSLSGDSQDSGTADTDGRKPFIVANLLVNNPSQSGAENLNSSVEQLEYTLLQAIHVLCSENKPKIAFIEGHGELPEMNTADLQQALTPYFDIYFGTITDDAQCLNDFNAIVIADPTQPFSEHDKYIIDQYIMRGGRVLWTVNGVRFSDEVLTNNGFTPALPLELNLQDMLFKYGIRVNHNIVQDIQCLPVPVDISADPARHDYHPMPWVYSPLLIPSAGNAVTHSLMPVNATFASTISLVDNATGQQNRDTLLATSSNSRTLATPAEIDLTDLTQDPSLFTSSRLPVAVSVDGMFTSLFEHRLIPENVTNAVEKLTQGQSRQVVVACGSAIRNEVQNGKPLPLGYDRYSKMQFSNRDFFVNTLLYLTDCDNLLQLRKKDLTLRLLNKQRTHNNIPLIRTLVILLPLLILALTAFAIRTINRKRYSEHIVTCNL